MVVPLSPPRVAAATATAAATAGSGRKSCFSLAERYGAASLVRVRVRARVRVVVRVTVG